MPIQVSRRVVGWSIGLASLVGAATLSYYYFFTTDRAAREAFLFLEAVVCGLLVVVAGWRNRELPPAMVQDRPAVAEEPKGLVLVGFVGVLLLWALLFAERWQGLKPFSDDHYHLGMSADWAKTRANLWLPYNEHLLPPARLISFAANRLGEAVGLEMALAWVGAALFLPVMVLLFGVVREQSKSSLAGLFAVAGFSLTTVYGEVFTWYSASLWLIVPSFLLAALWVLEASPCSITPPRLLAVTLICFVAVYSFSIGVLVGPVVSVWIILRGSGSVRRRLTQGLFPVLGTVVGVAAATPHMLRWFGTQEYLGNSSREALKATDPVGGVAYAVRLSSDMLIARNLGVPWPLSQWWLQGLVFAAATWFAVRLAGQRRWGLAELAPLSIVVFGYGFVLPFRTFVPYDTILTWTRYQLFPHLGLTLFAASVVVRSWPQLWQKPLCWRGVAGVWGLGLVMVLVHRLA